MVYRRAEHLVCYWRQGHFILHHYRSGRMCGGTPDAVRLLGAFDEWRTLEQAAARLPGCDADWLARNVAHLVRDGLLDARPRRSRRVQASAWDGWDPAAGFFHFVTRLTHGPDDRADEAIAWNWQRLSGQRRPPPFKRVASDITVSLPEPDAPGELPEVLRARRTWRRFGRDPVRLADLATLLHLTFGVQLWARNEQGHRFALRTSPSGGALQPIEAYVVASGVTGLQPGAYHYDPAAHVLRRVRGRVTRERATKYLAGQWWFARAPVLVFMSAMFSRTQWKYTAPRAYRTILTEAGHFCQTFCLVATALGLAPFCTQALADPLIERDLGIDGVREAVVYAAGCGVRPGDAAGGLRLDAGHPGPAPS